jgi:hypothetical protein
MEKSRGAVECTSSFVRRLPVSQVYLHAIDLDAGAPVFLSAKSSWWDVICDTHELIRFCAPVEYGDIGARAGLQVRTRRIQQVAIQSPHTTISCNAHCEPVQHLALLDAR